MTDIEQIADNFDRLTENFKVPRDILIEHLSTSLGVQPKKKRGAPFGNQNARKHGLYSKYLSPERIKKLRQVAKIDDLAHEIIIIRLLLDTLLSDPNTSTDELYKAISMLTKLVNTNRRNS